MKQHAKAILHSYPEILFLQGGATGVAILAVTLLNPNVGLAGVISVVAAYALARLINMDKEFLASGFYTYNPLLVGLSVGYLFRLAPLTVFFAIAAGMLAFVVTAFLAHVLRTYLVLPVLSLPFVVVSSLVYLASLRYSNLLVAAPGSTRLLASDWNLPVWLSGFFLSFGAILFAPSVLVGAIFSLIVFRASRILFMLAIVGYYAGACMRWLMLGSGTQAFADPYSFNFILIAMAVGGVFLVPSLGSYLVALVAVGTATIVLDAAVVFLSYCGLPVFTLPFNLISLGFIYVLGLAGSPLIARSMGRTPEETLENHLSNRLRYRGEARKLQLPFAGAWTVWQGVDGQWTHKGNWRYAFDFVITDDEGQTHRNSGVVLDDYYAFRKPVLSPVRGRVVQVVSDLPDTPIGSPDTGNNWGNVVLIQDTAGLYVELSHFAADSICVAEGDWLEPGAPLGLCGNSGYSPQPHIHIQVQDTDVIGAATLPSSFISYAEGSTHQANNVPQQGQTIETLRVDKELDRYTSLVLDDVLEYAVLRNGEEIDRIQLTVGMAPDGTFYMSSRRGKLYFGKHDHTFFIYRTTGDDRYLNMLFQALPRLPLGYRPGLCWDDFVPVGVATSGVQRPLIRFLSSFWPKLGRVRVTQRFLTRTEVESTIESKLPRVSMSARIRVDSRLGIASIRVNELELVKVDHEES